MNVTGMASAAQLAQVFVHDTAVVDAGASIGSDTKIWHFSHVYSGAIIGCRCSFGQNTMVADGVRVGDNVKVQNNVAIYEGTMIEDDVFLGPSCVLTNVSNPRSQVVRRSLCETTTIRRGATVGANATVVCGITIGRYAFVAAGSVVTRSVSDYELIVGVPAKPRGWMSRHGHPLKFDTDDSAVCPESGLRYQRSFDNVVHCIDLPEDRSLPDHLANGRKSYREYRSDD